MSSHFTPWVPTSGILRLSLLVVVSTCGEAEETFDPPARVAIPPEAVVASFGELSDTTEVEVLTWARRARLSESGRYLAIGDRSAPFLRILDRETGARRSFGPKGGGPGELMSAYALDFLGDSTLLVLSAGQRLERFSVMGEWLGGHRMQEARVSVMSIAVACGERIFAYGVPFGDRQLDTVPWLHELDFRSDVSAADSSAVSRRASQGRSSESPRATRVSAETRLEIPGTGYLVSWGALYGFDGNEDGVLLWHRAREPQVGYWLPCDGSPASIWSHTVAREVVERMMTLEDGEVRGSMLTLPDTVFQGAAVLGQTKIRTRRALAPDDGIDVTEFHVVDGDVCREVEIVGAWTLHDAHPDGLVIDTSDPYPIVQVIDWAWLEGTLTRVRCGL